MFKDSTEPALNRYLTNIYLCWEFALLISIVLCISRHFKRFQLNNLLSQQPNWATSFINSQPLQNFFHFYGPLFGKEGCFIRNKT